MLNTCSLVPRLSHFSPLFCFCVLYWTQTEEQKTGEAWDEASIHVHNSFIVLQEHQLSIILCLMLQVTVKWWWCGCSVTMGYQLTHLKSQPLVELFSQSYPPSMFPRWVMRSPSLRISHQVFQLVQSAKSPCVQPTYLKVVLCKAGS